MDSDEISFGRFRLDPRRRELFREDQPVRLGGRALDILCALASAKGDVVSKDDLLIRLWRGRTVEEGNLHVQVSVLRKALDDDGGGHSYVVTVPGRGYRLAGLAGSDLSGPTGLASAPGLPLPDKPSIAVLPFQNLSSDSAQDYFVDGMVEEIITSLSRIRWLFVIARNSSFTYKGQAIDVKRVGRELGVRYAVEGSVRKSNGRVRITAQLIEADTGAHLWADHFDGSLEDVFDLQDKVAAAVAGVIEPALQAAETERSVRRPTGDPTAYDLYLRACSMVLSVTAQARQALRLLEQAIARDPHYAPALAWAAFCCYRLLYDGRSENPEADRLKGRDFAQRALQVAGDDPGVLANAAFAQAYFGAEIGATLALVDRALALNPNFARGWYVSGVLNGWAGELNLTIEHVETSLRLSPRARTGAAMSVLGQALFLAGRFDEAVAKLHIATQEDPSYPQPYRLLAACYAHMGCSDSARKNMEHVRALAPAVFPDVSYLRNPAHRELFLSGLRLAAGEAE
jgi:adenylate cyclase